ncbi:MAG: CoA transferase [Hyphomicrobiales bacterium]|nr:CoA transferase [Hyphomicrobiales bacterium]
MGPLAGLKVLEFAGLGPAPFACMVLADLGADVVRIDRGGGPGLLGLDRDLLDRGRRSVVLDLKSEAGLATARRLAGVADVLVEGFRPGVMERLGLGPEALSETSPGLVYARMTGWGQSGPLADTAGHDLGYIAVTGALHAIGEVDRPVPPLNLVGDFGGGSMMLVTGILAALFERQRSGRGQVIDAAITDGTSLLMAMIWSMKGQGTWRDGRAANLLDGGSAAYRAYPCADGRHLAVAPLERKFFETFARCIGLDPAEWPDHLDRSVGEALAARIGAILKTKSRDDWCALFEGTDACVAPVLALEEAPDHPHNRARGAFVEIEGVIQPAPAPRFSRSVPPTPKPPPRPGEGGEAALTDWLG